MVLRPGVCLLGLYLAATLIPSAALGWLGWRLKDQEYALHARRVQDRLDSVVERSLTQLRQRIVEWDERLLAAAGPTFSGSGNAAPESLRENTTRSDSVVLLLLYPNKVEHLAGKRLLYYPALPPALELPPSALQRAEFLELVERNYASAHDSAIALQSSPDQSIRAAARLIAARNLRKMGKLPEAIGIYEELAKAPSSVVRSLPADLLARSAHCELLAQLRRQSRLQREARRLHADLSSGRWRLTHTTFEYYRKETEQWLEYVPPVNAEDRALAQAASALWEEWRTRPSGSGAASGLRAQRVEEQHILALWRNFGSASAVLLATPALVDRELIRPLVNSAGLDNVRLRIQWNDEGGPAAATPAGQVARTAVTPGLPWTLTATVLDPTLDAAEIAAQGRILLAALFLLAAVIATATFFTARAMRRELEISRLKSDFVAAVSHDFRTPLTAVSQAAELIAENRVSCEEQRAHYANLLVRETLRLQRLVDSLLEFATVEGGARRYRLQPVDYSLLLRQAATLFAPEAASKGYRLIASLPDEPLAGRADSEALLRALSNLLHNAIQYSPGRDTVWLQAERAGGCLAIEVRDQGVGIPQKEQKAVFRKFVRGSNAAAAEYQGTGIGLSIVEHVVRAHRGRIRIQSQPGEGSTFTILLPLE